MPDSGDRQVALRLLACVYTKLRDRLIELAPFVEKDPEGTNENRRKLLAKISELSGNANFIRALNHDHGTLWFEIWSHPLYANYRANVASRLIDKIVQSGQFDDPIQLATDPEFEIAVIQEENSLDKPYPRAMTDRVEEAFIGPASRMLIGFAGTRDWDRAIVSLPAPRAYRILWLARWYAMASTPEQPLGSLIGSYRPSSGDDGHTAVEKVWPVVKSLSDHMGLATALHTMADLGFPVVKPDIWLVRMSAQAGLFPDLTDLTEEELVKRVTRSVPRIKKLISFYVDLAKLVDPLEADTNVLREIDFVLAKYGMLPEPPIGLVRVPAEIRSVRDAVEECEAELDRRPPGTAGKKDRILTETQRTPGTAGKKDRILTETQRTPGNAKGRSRMVSAGEFVWTVATAGGQGTTVAEQTRATLAQLEANLLEAGSGKDRIVEAVVYLTDMNRKAEMDAVWCNWIPADGWPSRACVGTALAPGDLVEIKVTALKRG